MKLTRLVAVTALAGSAVLVPVTTAGASPDTDCMRAGMNAFSAVAKDGLPISTAVAVGVRPRAGTDVASLPDPLPLNLVLADHRAGANSLFIYPWCS